jgi:hypothetical protein
LAVELGLGDMGEKIRKIIDDIRAPIKKVIGKVLKVIADQGKKLWDAGQKLFLERLGRVKEWWKKPRGFQYGEEPHELTLTGPHDHPQVMVHSDEGKPLEKFLEEKAVPAPEQKKIVAIEKGLSWKEGDAQKPSDDEHGSAELDKLQHEMATLKPLEVPVSEVKEKSPLHPEHGSATFAEALLSNKLTEGSPARGKDTDPPDPPVYNDLGYLIKKKTYIRGHLINNRLGGHAKWANLMPITNTVNGDMERAMERALKKATADKKNVNCYHLQVTPEYASPAVPAIDETLTGAEKDAQLNKRSDIAEGRLVSLRWTVNEAIVDPADKTKLKGTKNRPRDENNKEMPDSVVAGSIKPTGR